MKGETGKTRDVGFQFGIRKTLSVSLKDAWDFLFSRDGIRIWLGEISSNLEVNKKYKTNTGVEGVVRILKPLSHIRLNWKKPDWNNMSTLQIRVIENKDRTVISIHQEKLLNSEQRADMQKYWGNVITNIAEKLTKPCDRVL
ncbi:MAG: SRPBCC domain-containing protein [Candidatus Cloacimonetes bacterium]|nr:SRPBCC domain-containing protein [Candidatus Cloacimonadota bacterium]